MRVWYHSLFTSDAERCAAILSSLANQGIDIHPLGNDPPSGPGILFFDRWSGLVADGLRTLSHGGLERVLAIAVRGSLVDGNATWQALAAGASDVFAWDHSDKAAPEVTSRFERWEFVDRLVRSSATQENLVGHSLVWVSALRRIVEAAYFTDADILVTGESGTGKELVAHLIHKLNKSARKRELVIVDCTTVVPELSGSEFFGHERGAFTGAVAAREGAFALANGGTLFLDEVGDLPLTLQSELLRVVQEHTYKRVGSNTWQRTEFRLVCATNRDLLEEIANNRFRRDLYYRIAGLSVHLPALRDRVDDIPILVQHFMEKFSNETRVLALDEPVRRLLLTRDYRGNVRDLRKLISQIMYHHVGSNPITVGDIPEEERPKPQRDALDWSDGEFERAIRRAVSSGAGLKEIGRKATETAICIALNEEEGNLHRAAQRLGVTDRALQMRRSAQRDNGEARLSRIA